MKQDQASNAENEAEILFPDMELTINGEKITVKEINFVQGLRLGAVIRPLIDDLAVFFGDDKAIDLNDVTDVFFKHEELFIEMLSITTGKDKAWIDDLDDADGQSLLMSVWLVNSTVTTLPASFGPLLVKSASGATLSTVTVT